MSKPYEEFLRAKVAMARDDTGLACDWNEISPVLMDHQKAMVKWAIEGGQRALFAAFGMGKSMMQLEVMRIVLKRAGGMGLIVLPLGVRYEFRRDAEKLGIDAPFIRSVDETDGSGIYLTNYESVREGKIDPRAFTAASLDEASVLRGFGGTKTFREFMATFAGDRKTMDDRVITDGVPYRFVATATPSPNDYIELLAYAAFLGIMSVSEGKTRFFKRDSEKADNLTIHPHKEREFWLWVASWGLFVQKPSDLGYSDEGYDLPAIDVRWHEIPDDHEQAGFDYTGQGMLLKEQAVGLADAAKTKRDSIPQRVAKMMEIRSEEPGAHRLIWHDLERERKAIKGAIPGCVTVQGSDTDEHKERSTIGFSDGEIAEMAGKPVMLGSGCNFQRHCHWAIFLGIGYKFNDGLQAIHRLHRFQQTEAVRIDFIYMESERHIRDAFMEKWRKHSHTVEQMGKIIKEYGLSNAAMADELKRAMGVERVEVSGADYTMAHNDCIVETRAMADNSLDLILTSVPFSTQYEYSPNYADMGHTDNNAHFFEQLDYLTPELLRSLKPGRLAAIHVKDRIVPGGLTGLGYQTVYPFHAKCIEHYQRHGFGYMGMITVVTDVVRENNQTYRLGWSEQCKDGSKMSAGLPEYILLFRKMPTETTNAYADEPVTKSKPDCYDKDGNVTPWKRGAKEVQGTGYSRSRWQVDAHAFWRSGGNRLMTPEELKSAEHKMIFRWFRDYHLNELYDHEQHVRIGETIDGQGRLPTTFMLLQPPSWVDDVWTDVARMRTLNTLQSQKGKEQHLCPLPFDICNRIIERFSNPGDLVYDPFGGIGSVPYSALLKGRKAYACELSPTYFEDACFYLKAAEREMSMPGLFDALEATA